MANYKLKISGFQNVGVLALALDRDVFIRKDSLIT